MRRTRIVTGWSAAVVVLAGWCVLGPAGRALGQAEGGKYVVPESARVTYNFNPGWKFIKEEVAGSEAVAFADAAWQDVSTPHTYNDTDSYDELIRTSGEVTIYTGPARYRKHFKLPAGAAGNKVILEFEGMRQAAKFWVNGKAVGKYENGVTATGVDITDAVNFGDQENVLAVWITNAQDYREESSGSAYQWESRDFNPNYGGINQNVWLHIVPKVYQTLPLVDGLNTTGTYIYPSNFNLAGKTATVNIEAQVKNESGVPQTVEYSAVVVDSAGNIHGQVKAAGQSVPAGEAVMIKASGAMQGISWWSPDSPALYDVYGMLTVGGKVADVNKITTGFRKAEFKGGAGTGGTFINDKFTYLKGYAIRSTNEWAAVGGAYPDWMRDFSSELLHAGNGNYIRWMHIAPKPADSRACDRIGIVQVCPGGDKEANPSEPQWVQRMDVTRKTIVYFRNSPSILYWETGNTPVTVERMQQMVALRKELDPNGGRIMGVRGNDNNALNTALTPISEWYGVMIGQDPATDRLNGPQAMFRGYSAERRDRAPLLETEDYRPESQRRFWDASSPPNFAQVRGPNDQAPYFVPSSEAFCLATAGRYNDYWSNRISNTDPAHAKWSGYASIIFADSNQHSRMGSSAVCRVSGKVDAVRIPKQAYFVHRVMQNEQPDVHIIGHWNYPADTKKTMYVAANHVDGVELFVNDASKGKVTTPTTGFIYPFPDIAWQAGTIKAVAFKGAQALATAEIKTVGPAARIKLTAHAGPKGLQADGSDVVFFDVEVVDAQGQRCPLDEARVDFAMTGPGIWRGGVNESVVGSINKTFLNTECGINRVFIRSTLTPGTITLKATREGLPAATIEVEAKPVAITGGLGTQMPQVLAPAKP
jgi:beta-galactosidase